MGQAVVFAARRFAALSFLVILTAGFGCATRSVWDVPVRNDQDTPPEHEQHNIEGHQTLTVRVGGPPLVVVIDDPHHAYLELMQVFSAELGRPYQIFNLAHRSQESVRAELERLAPIQVVVVGSTALSVASRVTGLDVVYGGVLNPGRSGAGVDALPPFPEQLDYWLSLSPQLKRIGVIGSGATRDRIDALSKACAERGLTLEHRQVGSDKEMLLAFRGMVPHIDGFVFLPDGEVLSPKVIEQVIKHGHRNDVQMLVYSPVMYQLGASLMVQPDPAMVAARLIDLLADPKADPTVRRMRVQSTLQPPVAVATAAATRD